MHIRTKFKKKLHILGTPLNNLRNWLIMQYAHTLGTVCVGLRTGYSSVHCIQQEVHLTDVD